MRLLRVCICTCMHPKEAGDLVTEGMERAEVPDTSIPSRPAFRSRRAWERLEHHVEEDLAGGQVPEP